MPKIDAADAYPLTWPSGMSRTPFRENSRFGNHSIASCPHGISWELQSNGIRANRIVISTNWAISKRGEASDDPGAAVYWSARKRGEDHEYCIACDKYRTVEDNLWSIYKSIEALRGLDRWGCTDILDRAFRGFEALPAPPPWWVVLEFDIDDRPDSIDVARDRYLQLSKRYHPDSGTAPDGDRMREINSAYETAKADFETWDD